MTEYRKSVLVGGREIGFSTGVLAQQAGGSILVQGGGTSVLVTATMNKKPREGMDFFPLLVDYEERLYAAGRIPGSFMRREARPPEKAILASRLIDRAIRPLFPDGFRNDVQIVATVLSLDDMVPPDILALTASSAAIMLAGLPFAGPIAGVRVGLLGDDFVLNPTYPELNKSDLDLVVAGNEFGVIMVEAGANRLPEEDVLEALDFGMEAIGGLLAAQREMVADLNIKPMEFKAPESSPIVISFIENHAKDKVAAILGDFLPKNERDEKLTAIEEEVKAAVAALPAEDPVAQAIAAEPEPNKIKDLFKAQTKKLMRGQIVRDSRRVDGRTLEEIRPISCAVRIIPKVHGCGLFTRGNTQVLSVLTMGTSGDAQEMDDLHPDSEKRYIHHYNFPGYSTGEVKPQRGSSRREIGHGALAERALMAVLPPKEEFAYVLRIVSEALSSNGSTSMASVCGSTLALMDAGVPIKEPVSGVAMGLIKEGDEVRVLTDIQGIEDFLGDMDFKVAGTQDGITALQMDIKITGITLAVLETALNQAKGGRLHILEKMLAVLDKPRPELSPDAPRLLTIRIPENMIGAVIGPGGKNIKRIIAESGATVDIEDDGTVIIASKDGEAARIAQRMIQDMTRTIDSGKVYNGKVTRIIPIGAFVEILPGKEGMVHISQLAEHRVRRVEDEVAVGDNILVKVKQIDHKGRVNLTRLGIHPDETAEVVE
jgi:polyribonucleotide nucleotidyltransferase